MSRLNQVETERVVVQLMVLQSILRVPFVHKRLCIEKNILIKGIGEEKFKE